MALLSIKMLSRPPTLLVDMIGVYVHLDNLISQHFKQYACI
jgi:hypothetical protein